MASALATRNEENEEFKAALKDDEDAIALLQAADFLSLLISAASLPDPRKGGGHHYLLKEQIVKGYILKEGAAEFKSS